MDESSVALKFTRGAVGWINDERARSVNIAPERMSITPGTRLDLNSSEAFGERPHLLVYGFENVFAV